MHTGSFAATEKQAKILKQVTLARRETILCRAMGIGLLARFKESFMKKREAENSTGSLLLIRASRRACIIANSTTVTIKRNFYIGPISASAAISCENLVSRDFGFGIGLIRYLVAPICFDSFVK